MSDLFHDLAAFITQRVKQKAPEYATSWLVSELEAGRDPEIRFTMADESRARSIVRNLRKSAEEGDWIYLKKPAGRNALIRAAQTLTGADDVEWAVVGLGTGTEGGRSFVKQIYATRGKQGSVSLPVSLAAEIPGYLESEEGAEFVHIHNHPANARREVKNSLLGNEPVASWADRRFHFEYDLLRKAINEKAIRPRQVRCYVIENGEVRRYRLAAAPELIVNVVEELRRSGLSDLGTAGVLRWLSDHGLRPDPDLVAKIVDG